MATTPKAETKTATRDYTIFGEAPEHDNTEHQLWVQLGTVTAINPKRALALFLETQGESTYDQYHVVTDRAIARGLKASPRGGFSIS